MYNINVNLKSSYEIIIDENICFKTYISKIYQNDNIHLIIDENVYNLYKNRIETEFKEYNFFYYLVHASEENKSLETYNDILSKLIDNNITRDSLIVGIGGGVVGDIASFIASTILRGVKYVSIPTTLLSQVDSSIGGKTGLNLNGKKNILGTFYQPCLVLIDTLFLDTLTKEEYDNGLGEVIKYAMIDNKEILSLLKQNSVIKEIIYECLLIKKKYVEDDEFDYGNRMILNFGHTLGHIFELEKKIKHGYAVIDGMISIIKFGIDLKITSEHCLDYLIDVLDHLNIKYNNFEYKDFFNKIDNDKKSKEKYYNVILLKDIAKPIVKQIERK